MPRGPRKESPTGIYHVMTRGINKEQIFGDEADRQKYLQNLLKVKGHQSFELYAYCLMNNHTHMAVKVLKDSLQRSMQRINGRYAGYFNWKHGRIGHLYQDRYRSEEILTDKHLLACIRYIHNNPVKANLVSNPGDYPWSSYNAYVHKEDLPGLVDREFVLSLFHTEKDIAEREFTRFSSLRDESSFMDIENEEHEELGLEMKKEVIANILSKYNMNAPDLRSRSYAKIRPRVIREIMSASKVTVNELADLLGVSTHMIYRSKLQK